MILTTLMVSSGFGTYHREPKKKKYNLSECETTNLMLLQRTTLHGNYHKKDF